MELETQYDYDNNYMKLFVNFQTLYFVTSILFIFMVICSSSSSTNTSGQNRLRREYV